MDLNIDLLPFPEESTIVDLKSYYSSWDLIKKALEIIVEERDLKNVVKLKKSIKNNEIVINNFFIQIVFCSFFNDEVIIPTKKWFIRNKAPQLILASKIDEENNIVHFVGVITAQEFKKILVDNKKVHSEIKIPINKFEGGIELLFSYIQFIKPSSIPRTGFSGELLEGKIEKSEDLYIENYDNTTSKYLKDSFLKIAVEEKSNHTRKKYSAKFASDSINYYLSSIGRVPLLKNSEELELAYQVQQMVSILQTTEKEITEENRQLIKIGKKAKDRMMASYLRLVVSIAKKYQNQGKELIELVQEGAIGLEKAIYEFNPSMEYKFSNFAQWWINNYISKLIDPSRENNLGLEKISLRKEIKIETLEKYCDNQFKRYLELNNIHKVSFERCDYKVPNGSLYVFREYDQDDTEVISILFGLYTTFSDKLFKESDFNRKYESCEYAVIVSLFEKNDIIHNQGFIDYCHEYSKMYAIKPQFFISLLLTLKGVKQDQKRIAFEEEIDIEDFENNIYNFKETNFKEVLETNVSYNWLPELTKLEREILNHKYGLEGKELLRVPEISEKLKISETKIKQLEKNAFLKLKDEALSIAPLLKEKSKGK